MSGAPSARTNYSYEVRNARKHATPHYIRPDSNSYMGQRECYTTSTAKRGLLSVFSVLRLPMYRTRHHLRRFLGHAEILMCGRACPRLTSLETKGPVPAFNPPHIFLFCASKHQSLIIPCVITAARGDTRGFGISCAV